LAADLDGKGGSARLHKSQAPSEAEGVWLDGERGLNDAGEKGGREIVPVQAARYIAETCGGGKNKKKGI